MGALLAGLFLLLAVQPFVLRAGTRIALRQRYGDLTFWIGVGAIVSAASALIVAGKNAVPYQFVWLAPAWLQTSVLPIMFCAFIIGAASIVPSNLRRFFGQPIFFGVLLWAIAHLITRTDLGSITLFAGLGVASALALMFARGDRMQHTSERLAWSVEVLPVAFGGVLFLVAFYLHAALIGIPPMIMGRGFQ